MKLTEEQRTAVNHQGHVALIACPGSGKTRAIVAKLLKSIEDVRGGPRKVACITYTNAAVHEIESRIRTYGSTGDENYCEISTIHSFCQSNVLRHFHWMLEEYKEGFSVLPSDSEEFQEYAKRVAATYGLDFYARQSLESLNRQLNGEPICPSDIPRDAALELWNLLQSAGSIDFCNLVYYSYRLLQANARITAALAARFSCILVDEFQDTSALQVEILSLIGACDKTELFVVGDPEQSIYRFAGAERDLMLQFVEQFSAKRLSLSGNFRSNCSIINTAESLIPRLPRMFAAGDSLQHEPPSIKSACDSFTAITDFFLPALDDLGIHIGDAAILARTWRQLRPLGIALREYDVPVVGPGARPYKKRHLFASLAEQVCAYVENPVPEVVTHVEREVFFLIQNVTGKANFKVFSFEGRRSVFRLLREGKRLKENHERAKEWLVEAGASFGYILFQGGLLPSNCSELLQESANDILQDMVDSDVDIENLTLSGLGMFADPRNNLKLLTLHGAKGREFSAVGIIALHDGWVPFHNRHKPLTREGEEEERRLLYVGITRAKRVLMLFSEKDNWRPRSRFLNELDGDSVNGIRQPVH